MKKILPIVLSFMYPLGLYLLKKSSIPLEHMEMEQFIFTTSNNVFLVILVIFILTLFSSRYSFLQRVFSWFIIASILCRYILGDINIKFPLQIGDFTLSTLTVITSSTIILLTLILEERRKSHNE